MSAAQVVLRPPEEMIASSGGFEAKYPVARTQRGDLLRPLKQPLYDTESMPASSTGSILFFSRQQGSSDASGAINPKTAVDTNLTQAGQLTVPDQYRIYGFIFETMPGTALADFRLIYKTGLFEFTFTGNRIYLQIPLTRVPAGVAPSGFAAIDGNSSNTQAVEVSQGIGVVSNYYAFDYRKASLMIQSAENFNAKLSYPDGNISIATATRLRVFILGIRFTAI